MLSSNPLVSGSTRSISLKVLWMSRVHRFAGYGISRAHLMKVANQLTWTGFLKAPRGRVGKAPDKPGDVVRATSPWLIALLQRTIA